MALADPRVALASLRALHVCTSCAKRLIDKGYAKEKGTITLGDVCEAHDGKHRPQATSLVIAPETEVTTPPDLGPVALDADELAETGEAPAVVVREPGRIVEAIGPVTEIAARLLVAWSTSEKLADDLMIAEAARVARALLRETKGA